MVAVEQSDVVVVGAGISGLAAARSLLDAGRKVIVLESRDRVGGRLQSVAVDGGAEGEPVPLDLGATWFWPGEPRVARLVEQLGLVTHPQHLDGDAVYHDPSGAQRLSGNPIDVPSFRFSAGAQSLPARLADTLPPGTVRLSTAVSRVELAEPNLTVSYEAGPAGESGSGAAGTIRAAHVVLALPPALAVHRIEFLPGLPERLAGLAAATPVWMGAVTKVVAVYPRPFWRDHGLAGAAISHLGPMREIHDMSGPDGMPAALFGFVPRPPADPAALDDAVIEQLATLFGPAAARPVELLKADWRQEPDTSPPGVDRLTAYQTFGHELYLRPAVGGRLHWSSTETGRVAPGHVEGALEAAERVVGQILHDGVEG